MANVYNNNPIVIDTFDADFTLGGTGLSLTVKKIVFNSAADTDVFCLLNGAEAGKPVAIEMRQDAKLTQEIDFGPRGQPFPRGLFFDASEINAGLSAGDRVLIYTL